MWKCSHCDTPNSELLTKCEVCGQPRPAESMSPSTTASKPLKSTPGSELLHREERLNKGPIWRQWLFANFIAFSLMTFFLDVTSVFVPLTIWGCALGLSQWLVVRRYLHNVGWWGVATAVSFVISFYVLLNRGGMPLWFSFGLLGIIVGLAQWVVVRHLGGNSGFWIFASAFAWGLSVLALTIYPAIGGTWWQFTSIGIVYGIISGWALLSIFYHKMRLLY